MVLKLASININGLRSNLKQSSVKDFILQNKPDILLLQETFVDNSFLAKSIEQNLGLDMRCIWNFGKGNSCGVAIFLLNNNISIDNFHCDFFGRIIRLDFSMDNFTNFRVINAYFPTEPRDRKEFIDSYSQYLIGAKHLILGGDFNFILDSNLDKIGGNLEEGMVGSKLFKPILVNFKLIDAFRYLFPTKRTVTRCRNTKVGMVGTRLDRFYISSVIKDLLIGYDTLPCSCSDHDFVVMNLACNSGNNGISFGKSYWKFNDDLLNDSDFVSSFELFWKLISRTENVTLDYWDKIKEYIKEFCIDFSTSKNKNLYGELKRLKKQYNSLNLKDMSDFNTFNEIKSRVKDIEDKLFKGSIIRSKAKCLENNEKPSSYFFQKEVSQAKSKTVKSVRHNNHTYTNSKDILNCFESFYSELYKEEPVDASLNHLFLDHLPQVTPDDNLFLGRYIEKSEILKALQAMQPNKSPGCDGLSSSFYLKFFHLLGDTLYSVINLAYENGELSHTQKLSYITLICKDETRADEMKCYRPISLLNIDYKVISKVIANRLGNILPSIIGIDQTSAIKGRSIFDNIHLLRNVIDYIEQKDVAACFICLDQEKAFDRVSWSFMLDTLVAFGFDDNFLKWVKLLYTNISSSVIVNNHISDNFPILRGVRQGCSLSPLLYVLCFEPFANKIRNLDEIKGLKMPGTNLEVKQTIYADDDTTILTSETSASKFFYWLKLFSRISGSKVNYDKTFGMFLGKWKNRSDHPFGISWVKSHKILGYTFGPESDTDEFWAGIFLKFDKTLNLWSKRQLSFKGKSTVLNSLGLAKILYFAAASEIPSHYETLLQRSAFRFVWNSKYEPIARNTLYLDYLQGGLKIPNFRLKCEAMFLCHLQKLVCNYKANWTFFAKYWIGMQLRKFNQSFASNSIPHSEYVPPFYESCLNVLRKVIKLHPDFSFDSNKSKHYYTMLLNENKCRPKIESVLPTVDFRCVWKSLNSNCIDPVVRDTSFRICHEVLYVNYYLFIKHISKTKACPFCANVETLNHLLIECKLVKPLIKIVLLLLRKLTSGKIVLSELIFKFSVLPDSPKRIQEISLILLSELRYVIWINRNLVKHENKQITSYSLVANFLGRIKFRILVDRAKLSSNSFVDNWSKYNIFCNIDLYGEVEFHSNLNVDTYFQKVPT